MMALGSRICRALSQHTRSNTDCRRIDLLLFVVVSGSRGWVPLQCMKKTVWVCPI